MNSRRVCSSHSTSVRCRLLTKPLMWLRGNRSSCAVAARISSADAVIALVVILRSLISSELFRGGGAWPRTLYRRLRYSTAGSGFAVLRPWPPPAMRALCVGSDLAIEDSSVDVNTGTPSRGDTHLSTVGWNTQPTYL